VASLAELRRAAGLTQHKLAEKTGISWSQIQKLEYGQSRPTWETLRKLAQVLGPGIFEVEFTTQKTGKPGRRLKAPGESEVPE
jgi:transcriptional regulator with XRE-family HTH domain